MKMNMDGMGAPGGNAQEATAKSRDIQMKGLEIKVLTPSYIQELVERKQSYAEVRKTLEKEFPQYRLPSQADIDFLKVEKEDKRENMGKLAADVSGGEFTLLAWEGDEPSRTRYVKTENSFDEQPLHSEQKDYKHLRPEDCIFLIKKTNN